MNWKLLVCSVFNYNDGICLVISFCGGSYIGYLYGLKFVIFSVIYNEINRYCVECF